MGSQLPIVLIHTCVNCVSSFFLDSFHSSFPYLQESDMQLADAISNALVQSMDPNAAAQRDALKTFVNAQADTAKAAKGDKVASLAEKLISLKASGFDEKSIPYQCIEKLMKDLVA